MATEFALLKQPWDIITVYYDYNEPLEQLGKKLAGTLDEIDNKKYKNVYIVSHSYGGLLTQEALQFMEVQRNKDSSKYEVMQKIRKAILMAAPNKGSPAIEIYKKLDIALLASELEGEKFVLNDQTLKQLATGKTIPRVKGVKYEVIVGTAPYSFTNSLFKELKGENDGVVTTTSAQTIGGEPVNNMCKDYYEIKLTHTELNDNPLIAKLIMRSINDDHSEQRREETIAGYTNYYSLTINKCSPDTTYTIIGEPILPEEAYDPTNCACGNGYCGVGEDESTCPKDCAVIKRESATCTIIIPAVLYLLLSALLVLTLTSLIKTMLKKETMRTVIKGTVIELLVVALAVVQYVQCGSINLLLYASSFGMMIVMLITIIQKSVFESKQKTSEQESAESYKSRPKILFSIKKFRPYFQPAPPKKEKTEPKIIIVKKKYKKAEIIKSLKKAKLWKK
ncbi:alpha/beta hydrolase [Candidatus Woesearchaeota archaeon]|nr:alpha/beta hydrolase [Candidatus Woesearchaeota archaeon]